MFNKTQFFSFDEAVSASKAEPGVDFLGLRFVEPYRRLDIYSISTDADDADYVNVQYEGGELFDLGGEEDCFDLEDVPDQAKKIFYARLHDLTKENVSLFGTVGEYVLHAVLPELKPADQFSSEAEFVKEASTRFKAFWRQS